MAYNGRPIAKCVSICVLDTFNLILALAQSQRWSQWICSNQNQIAQSKIQLSLCMFTDGDKNRLIRYIVRAGWRLRLVTFSIISKKNCCNYTWILSTRAYLYSNFCFYLGFNLKKKNNNSLLLTGRVHTIPIEI